MIKSVIIIGLKHVILVLWFVMTCQSVCPGNGNCTCTPFGRTGLVIVKCNVTGYIPSGIPPNTVQL